MRAEPRSGRIDTASSLTAKNPPVIKLSTFVIVLLFHFSVSMLLIVTALNPSPKFGGMGGITSKVSPIAKNTVPITGTSSRAVNMSGKTAEFVKDAISKNSVVIFSKTYCPYCKMAKDVFDKLQHVFTAYELDKRDDGDSIQDVLGEMTGARSVPRVFLNGEFIGGGSDVQALFEAGKLKEMLVPVAAN